MPSVCYNIELLSDEWLSVVDKGASGNEVDSPRIVLVKRDATAKGCDSAPKPPSLRWMTKESRLMTPEERQAAVEALRAALSPEQFAQAMALVEDAAVKPEAPVVQEAKADESEEEAVKAMDEPEDEEISKAVEIEKRRADEMADKVAELRKRLDERDRNDAIRECVELAKRDLAYVPGSPAAIGKALYEAKRSNKDAYETLMKALKASADALAKSEIMKAQVPAEQIEGSARAELENEARDIAKRLGIPMPQARFRVMSTNKELCKRVKAEQVEG